MVSQLLSIGDLFDKSALKSHPQTMQLDKGTQAEVAPPTSAEIYRTMAKNFPNGAILLFDRNCRYLVADGVELAAFGHEQDSLEGKTLHEAFAPEVCEFFEPLYQAALAGETKVSQFQYGDRFYSVNTLPVTNCQGEIAAGMVMIQNITERHQAEATLRSQAERERLLSTLAKRIRASLKLEEVLNTAVAEVREFLQTDRVLFYSFDPDSYGVMVESTGEDYTQILGTPLQDTCFVDDYVPMYKRGGIQAFENIRTAGIKRCQVDLLTHFQVKASLVVPVLQGEKLWGLIFAHHCRETRKWQEAEVELLQQLSVHVAIALHQAELYEHLEAQLKERKAAEAALRQSQAQVQKRSQQLEETLYKLKSTQAQLIQSEKMSSLGQLVAGIAHEINNPVSFICGNISYASEYAQYLLNLVQLYSQHYPEAALEIQAAAADFELDFIVEDFPKLLRSMQVGVDRIRQIVTSLRTFSRLDEAERKFVDIHEGIENTLLILQHRLKPDSGIQVLKEYGNLQQVECYAGQLNQVFMNLLTNAIDALEETKKVSKENSQSSANHPTIWIFTEIKDTDSVVIRIRDNGSGIPEQVQTRIFEPFFTTKPTGSGTGLGLAISYQIVVERHGGQIKCLSEPGKGTEFVVEIPRQLPDSQSKRLSGKPLQAA